MLHRLKENIRPFLQQHAPEVYQWLLWNTRKKKYDALLGQARRKPKLKVAFLVLHSSVWKYDLLYGLMKASALFEPLIVICPYRMHGEKNMHEEMQRAMQYFTEKGYEPISAYNPINGEWIDIKTALQPDIVFFTNPHDVTLKQYYIHHFEDTLSCYVPYAFVVIHVMEMHYNLPFQNLLWRAYYETNFHKQFAQKYADNKGRNVLVTGYPGVDKLLDKNYTPKDPWKIKDIKIKRLIWAPHHSIETAGGKDDLDYSNFLVYADYMLTLLDKYAGEIQISFKPHPILYPKLCAPEVWGEEKTKRYYESWEQKENGQLNETDYIDLFLTSDAMIHDCASFMAEYLYVDKPVLFTTRDNKITDRFNEFGREVFKHLYHAANSNEITDFIDLVLLGGQDAMQEERKLFVQELMLPPNGKTASENIYFDLLNQIRNNQPTQC